MILNRKIYMHQMKMRDIYLIDATEEKIKDILMEVVKFYSLNARKIRETYDYL